MRQLGELQKRAEEFEKLDAELIFVFREEAKGVEGLKIIAKNKPTKYTLAIDPNKKSSKAYSTRRMTFDNFVIGKDGKVVKIWDVQLCILVFMYVCISAS
ncbi:MAG: redoxin domain-containing protein, partial [Planctomycetota bacterium]